MTIRRHHIEVRGISIEVVRKNIKNLHLGVYPPNGRVRVAVPQRLDDDAVRLAVISHLKWIRTQQDRFEKQERQSQREMLTGESHYVEGRRYRLNIIEYDGPNRICLPNNRTLELRIRPGTDRDKREALLYRWYRQRLRAQIPPLITKWETKIGVTVVDWGIRKMKTRWGTCNINDRRIWLNLELAKKPAACLEYILVHEMVHLLERHHNERFQQLMSHFMPHWRLHREELNRAPLAHENWLY
ncbi:MAG: M48 family metallopeptidase [Chloroflexi bacterium AL-W]|nr:M48 family metallopeptidase [Chloroflexi bacterium AL-N1]NOK68363.1 M48 family metallopeptidase [Chloroflexi bacterium AL-N10]NOK74009.1 M48 family metallopeptidase [Chloroflexi bacterium AL-N5]NOK82977.1 M48 family metallopeptidase [Chloroflexi bacterium AL-W]NOK90499.1 M48 family metallopeptidase [Chloroflexi bacterium AL-N15]